MNYQQKQNTQQRTSTAQELSGQQLLEEMLNRPMSERHRALDSALVERVPKIEELLPEFMKGQGERLAKRAMMTFARTPDLQQCPPADFVRCVLEAAEMGFAIDGKMCYVVKYKAKYQCQLDYKGIVAVARRMKTIKDIYGDVVGENDHFVHRRVNGKSELSHTYEMGEPRGNIIGAYCVVTLPSGDWRYEVMGIEELDRIQARAPAKNGPWSSDINEMRKKTVFRRCLKMYGDDPGLIRVLELTDELDSDETGTVERPRSVAELHETLNGRGRRRANPADDFRPTPGLAAGEMPNDEPPVEETHDRPQETDEVDTAQVEAARKAFAECKTKAEVAAACKFSGCNAATITAIDHLAIESEQRIENAPKAGKQKELVSK